MKGFELRWMKASAECAASLVVAVVVQFRRSSSVFLLNQRSALYGSLYTLASGLCSPGPCGYIYGEPGNFLYNFLKDFLRLPPDLVLL